MVNACFKSCWVCGLENFLYWEESLPGRSLFLFSLSWCCGGLPSLSSFNAGVSRNVLKASIKFSGFNFKLFKNSELNILNMWRWKPFFCWKVTKNNIEFWTAHTQLNLINFCEIYQEKFVVCYPTSRYTAKRWPRKLQLRWIY